MDKITVSKLKEKKQKRRNTKKNQKKREETKISVVHTWSFYVYLKGARWILVHKVTPQRVSPLRVTYLLGSLYA